MAVLHCCVAESRLTLVLCFILGKVKHGAGGAARGSSLERINRGNVGDEKAGLRVSS